MSDSSNNVNKYYVNTPIAADYEGANSEVLSKASKFGSKSHRLLSDKNKNIIDRGSTNFKYLESTLFSNKEVKFNKNQSPSMFDTDYIKKVKSEEGCVYKVLRFNRSHNIRSFDFILTYTQLNAFGSEIYKPVVLNKQFIGRLLFTGCSIIRDADTMEELPLRLCGKYESIGDTVNNNIDLDANVDAKGGPTITFKYSFDNDYIYLFIASLSPFRLIPMGDGEFIDISYAEGKGSLISENKKTLSVIADPITGSKKSVNYFSDNRVYTDVVLSLKDTTISHDTNDIEFVDYDDVVMNNVAILSRAQDLVMYPTNDGEQIIIGMEPASTVNMEIAPNLKPIRFGSNLLNSSKENIKKYVDNLRKQIIDSATNIEKVPFNIKTTIRSKGKYNINGNFFIDNQADSMGAIIIQDIGVYDNITGTFDITEYVFDINQNKYEKAKTVKRYREYVNNASDYLTSISKNHPNIPTVRKTNTLMDTILNIDFDTPEELDVYFNAAFARSSVDFDVLFTFTEFGNVLEDNSDDYIVYFCKDDKIRIINFKDYQMENIYTFDIKEAVNNITLGNDTYNYLSTSDHIVSVTRSEKDGKYFYYIGTEEGKFVLLVNSPDEKISSVKVLNAFNNDDVTKEKVSFIKHEDNYIYVGGINGSISIYNIDTDSIKYIKTCLRFGDEIIDVNKADEDNVIVISKKEINSYNLMSDKWNSENSSIIANSVFDNPFKDLPYPNIDLILNKEGFKDVPVIQKDIYAYILGVRLDREAGYYPVYKKVNLLTGEIKNLPLPDEDLYLYKSKLCKDKRYIYCIGGTSVPHMNDPVEERDTYYAIFDTLEDTWVPTVNNKLSLDNSSTILNNNSDFYPVANNGKIYIAHPKASVIGKNEDTGLYVMSNKRINKTYIITFEKDQQTGFINHNLGYLSEDEESKLPSSDINLVALVNDTKEKKIHFFSCVPQVIQSEYKGYVLTRYILDTETDTLSSNNESVLCGTELELSSLYSDGRFSDVQNDLFTNISVYSEYKESIIYCLDKFILYINSLDNTIYTEFHAIYHNISNGASHSPLLSNGDFSAWRKYNKKPSNTIILHIGNLLGFIGGDTVRVTDYLSLDSMSLIPAPRYFERKKGIEESSVISGNIKDVLNVVPLEGKFKYDKIATCRNDNTVYIVANPIESSRIILMKYELDDPSAKPIVIKTFYNSNAIGIFDLNILFNNDTVYISVITAEQQRMNIIVYHLNNDNVDYFNLDITNRTKNIYAFVDGTSVYYMNYDNGIKLTEYGGNVSQTVMTDNIFNLPDNDVIRLKIMKSVSFKNKKYFNVYNVDEDNRIDMLDMSNNTYSTLCIIPNSKGSLFGDISNVDNTLYFTKGSIGNTGTNDIYKLNLDDNSLKRALVNNDVSEYNPVIVSRKNKLYSFGSNGTFRVLISDITDKTFVSFSAEIKINKLEDTENNRFNPAFTVFNVNGNEIFAVFGGKQSIGTPITRTIDLYDVKRHIWKSGLELPVELSHFTVCENTIIGATEEIIASSSTKPYNKKVVIECVDYESMDFKCVVSDVYPNINGFVYPTFGKYAIDKENNILFVATVDTEDNITDSQIHKVDLNNNSLVSIAELPEIFATERTRIMGMVAFDGNLGVITYSYSRNNIIVLCYNSTTDSWNEITRTSLDDHLVFEGSDRNRHPMFTFDIYDEVFNSIKNKSSNVNYTKASLSVLKDDNAIHTMYISINDYGTPSAAITTSDFYKTVTLTKTKVNNIQSFKLNNNGFIYVENKDGYIYRIFPDNDIDNTFGVRKVNFDIKRDIHAITSNKDKIYYVSDSETGYAIYCKNLMTNEEELITDITTTAADKIKLEVFDNVLVLAVFNTGDNGTLLIFNINLNDKSVKSYVAVTDVCVDDGPGSIDWGDTGLVSTINLKRLVISNKDTVNIEYEGGTYKTYKVSEQSVDRVWGMKFSQFNQGCLINFNDGYYLFGKTSEVNDKVLQIFRNDKLISEANLFIHINKIVASGFNLYLFDYVGNVVVVYLNPFTGDISKISKDFNTDIDASKFNESDILIRSSNIIDLKRYIEFTNTNSIDSNHYCFDKNAISENNVIISLHNDTDGILTIYTYDKETHNLIKSTPVNVGKEDYNFDGNKFVYELDNEYYYCIVSDGKIFTINNTTGDINTITNDKIKRNELCIKLAYKKDVLIGNDSSSYLLLDTSNNTVVSKQCNTEGYTLDKIISTSKYFRHFYALVHKEGDTTYSLGKFDGDIYSNEINNLVFVSKTDIEIKETDIVIYKNNFGIIIDDGNKNVLCFDIDENRNEITNLRNLTNDVINEKCVDEKPLIEFEYDDRISDEDIGNITYISNASSNDNYSNQKVFEIKLSEDLHLCYYKREDVEEPNSDWSTGIITIENKNGGFKKFNTDVDLSGKYKTEFIDTPLEYDEVLGFTRYGHFVTVNDGNIDSYSLKISGLLENINDITNDNIEVELIKNNTETTPIDNIDVCRIVKVQNRHVVVIEVPFIYVCVLSNSNRFIVNKYTIDTPGLSSELKVASISDNIYLIPQDSTQPVFVISNICNGTLYDITDEHLVKNITGCKLDRELLNNFKDVIYADNDRICKNTDSDFGLYFNVLKNCSEFYNRYIGVAINGEVIDAEYPINEYDISHVEISRETNALALRSVENVKTTLNLIHKDDSKNIVAEANSIARLNTSKFRILFSNTNVDQSGEVYAFLNESESNMMLRDDTSYYKGNYGVAIIRDSIIKINVDNEVYTYSKAFDEIPLYNKILPIVICYGTRENGDTRYLSFADEKGNVITYDKELKTFIDISGYVDVDVPHFSTEAMIYPSKTKALDDNNIVSIKVRVDE